MTTRFTTIKGGMPPLPGHAVQGRSADDRAVDHTGSGSTRITLAGTPTATPPGGTSSSTTAFSPIWA